MSSSPTDLIQIRQRSPRAESKRSDDAATTSQASHLERGTLYMETYGCQMNVADSNLLVGQFAKAGYRVVKRPEAADVIVVNTCAVREKAEDRVFARSRELSAHKKKRGNVVLAITGCMAEHLKDKIAEKAPSVDVIAGPDSYRRLPELINRARDNSDGTLYDVKLDKTETYEGLANTEGAEGTDGVSGYVTIQRGCDKFCSFCVVPFTRGRERAVAPRDVLRQVRLLASQGYKEVVLLGQTVNSYRHAEANFSHLLRARVSG